MTFFTEMQRFEASEYKVNKLSDLKTFDTSLFPELMDWEYFNFAFAGSRLTNSSTNRNRKRAAYVLKRFFCDDMLAIPVEDIEGHTEGKHGSDPACNSCHYRLDPMAGFFKDRGILFSDFSKSNFIVFDDNATVAKDEYVKPWRAPESSGREWDIGYIRSLRKSSLNSYGESFDDLFALLRQAPEVRQCLVRRMFEYSTSPDQLIDGGYLNYVTGKFNQMAKENSARAFKQTLKTLLLSKTFAEADPARDQCYDFEPNYNPENAPPCQVAYIIQTNCKGCHSSSSRQVGGLSLSNWMDLGNGEKSFEHLDAEGKQIARKETMQRMLDRISSTDVKKRMPKGDMSVVHRDLLFRWLNTQVSQ